MARLPFASHGLIIFGAANCSTGAAYTNGPNGWPSQMPSFPVLREPVAASCRFRSP